MRRYTAQNIVRVKKRLKILCLFVAPVSDDERLTYVHHSLVHGHMTSSYGVRRSRFNSKTNLPHPFGFFRIVQ